MIRNFIPVVLFLSALSSVAQYRCGTDIENNKNRARNPFLAAAQDNYNELMRAEMMSLQTNRDGEVEAVFTLPIVFHVLHLDGPENISDAQILDAVEVLNRDYAKLNPDTINIVNGFDTIAANCRIQFKLATKDALGNCTNGIDRIRTIETLQGDNGSKLNQWPRERYINVWTVARINSGAAGYSQYPSSVIDQESARADGVIILHDYLGRIGTGGEFRSRALTHEIGHFLDLAHLWGSTNEPEVACGEDGVDDTPVTAGHSSCALNDFSCSAEQNSISSFLYNFSAATANSNFLTDVTPAPALAIDGEDFPRLNGSEFTAVGVGITTELDSLFAFSGWGSGAPNNVIDFTELSGQINTEKYYEFTVTPRIGSGMNLTAISFRPGRSESGPRTFAVRSSLNNFANNLAIDASSIVIGDLISAESQNTVFFETDTQQGLNASDAAMMLPKFTLGNTFSNLLQPVTFRIYAWNAEDNSGFFSVDDVKLEGSFGAIENIQNYMEYSYCSNMFTNRQKDRMRLALTSTLSGRNNLWTDTNRALTGTDDTPLVCAPQADFYPESPMVCLNSNITFRDNSTNGVVDTWNWTFSDGNPSTSNDPNPVVSFSSPGYKTVTLTVTNEQGSTTTSKSTSIYVSPEWTDFTDLLLRENFESYSRFMSFWTPRNYDANASNWAFTDLAGYQSDYSAILNAYDMDVTVIDEGGYDIDELISPSFNFTDVIGNTAEVTLKWAYATASPTIDDVTEKLEVFVSGDCGETWSATPRLSLNGLELVTAGNNPDFFVPSSDSDWSEGSFTISSSLLGPGFRMKFRFSAGQYPNNIYIDDINMNASLAVKEYDANISSLGVYPNPSDASATLVFDTPGGSGFTVDISDSHGRIVKSIPLNNLSAGKQTIGLDVSDLNAGLYVIRLTSSTGSSVLKMIIE